jgi:NADH:ubiquinone oxidoreductase subunit 5 (subunit L)/multisubunit Na+/H+ antiporter MnhA subunit
MDRFTKPRKKSTQKSAKNATKKWVFHRKKPILKAGFCVFLGVFVLALCLRKRRESFQNHHTEKRKKEKMAIKTEKTAIFVFFFLFLVCLRKKSVCSKKKKGGKQKQNTKNTQPKRKCVFFGRVLLERARNGAFSSAKQDEKQKQRGCRNAFSLFFLFFLFLLASREKSSSSFLGGRLCV